MTHYYAIERYHLALYYVKERNHPHPLLCDREEPTCPTTSFPVIFEEPPCPTTVIERNQPTLLLYL